MFQIFNYHTPKLVLMIYMVFKVWDFLPITVKADLPNMTLQNIALGALIVIFVYFQYWLWICPMDRVRGIEDVGYRHLGSGRIKAEAVNRARRLKKLGNVPPPFPNGWFVLLESRELNCGEVKQVDALGMNLAVFRGDSGEVFITDAYCPHLGANIGVGGRVRGDCIQCPFHDWKFSGHTGKCVEIPYTTSRIPEQAKIKTHICLERNNLVFMWHHADKEEPTWFPPVLDDVEDGSWVYQGRNEYHVNCHIQDIPENGADVAHLNAVHGTSILTGGEPTQKEEDATASLARHDWDISWSVGKEAHTSHVKLNHTKTLFGRFNIFILNVDALQIGPALVNLNFNSLLGKGVMLQYIVPLEHNVQKLVHVFYTQRTWIPPYAKVVLLGESILLERDIRVWNSKTYSSNPLLMKEDKLILQHRRWYNQFYSEKSRNEIDIKSYDW